MANTSIKAAFERMWQHIVLALGGKADKSDLDSLHNLVGNTPVSTQINTATDNLSEELKEYIDETFLGGEW